ncbi:MAG: hypothetical protein ACR2LT_02455 [Pyrinomonadaceae bacterium]
MDFGNLEETLLNEGKEKGRELAENFLDEQQARQGAGTMAETGIGIGKNMLENYLGDKAAENPRTEEEMPNAKQNSGGAATAEMSANADNDEDSNDNSDDSNDADNSDDADSDEANDDDAQTDDADDDDSDDSNDENSNDDDSGNNDDSDDDSDNDDDDSDTRNNR